MVFPREFFENVDSEKNQQTIKKHEKFPRGWGEGGKELNSSHNNKIDASET